MVPLVLDPNVDVPAVLEAIRSPCARALWWTYFLYPQYDECCLHHHQEVASDRRMGFLTVFSKDSGAVGVRQIQSVRVSPSTSWQTRSVNATCGAPTCPTRLSRVARPSGVVNCQVPSRTVLDKFILDGSLTMFVGVPSTVHCKVPCRLLTPCSRPCA